MSRLFERQTGWSIDAVGDGASALEHLEETPYDMVVLDLNLGSSYLSGWDVLAHIPRDSTAAARAPLVVVSSGDPVEPKRDARCAEYTWIPKPVRSHQLRCAAQRATDRSYAPAV